MSFTPQHLFFDDVEIGQEWTSLGRTLTESDIVGFAGLSGDFNPIHIDHEFAKTTPFRRPIAHGLLVWSISSGLGVYAPPMRTLAFLSVREWHFREPVFVGDTIRLRSKLLEKEIRSRGRRAVIAWSRQIINQIGKVVQEGVTLTIVQGRASIKDETLQSPAPLAEEDRPHTRSPLAGENPPHTPSPLAREGSPHTPSPLAGEGRGGG